MRYPANIDGTPQFNQANNETTMEHYRPLPACLTIKQSQLAEKTNRPELGLFATEAIPAGTELGPTHYIIESEDRPIYLIRTPLGGFFNHSETPNCQVLTDVSTEPTEITLKTTCDIKANQELTCRYTMYDPTGPYQALNQNKDNSWNSKYKEYLGIDVPKASQKIKNMKTLEEIINKNIEHLKKSKEMSINKGHEDLANETQININILLGTLHEYKNQNE